MVSFSLKLKTVKKKNLRDSRILAQLCAPTLEVEASGGGWTLVDG